MIDYPKVEDDTIVSLKICSGHDRAMLTGYCDLKINNLIEVVGLNYVHDASKRLTDMSGEMYLRVYLYLKLDSARKP